MKITRKFDNVNILIDFDEHKYIVGKGIEAKCSSRSSPGNPRLQTGEEGRLTSVLLTNRVHMR